MWFEKPVKSLKTAVAAAARRPGFYTTFSFVMSFFFYFLFFHSSLRRPFTGENFLFVFSPANFVNFYRRARRGTRVSCAVIFRVLKTLEYSRLTNAVRHGLGIGSFSEKKHFFLFINSQRFLIERKHNFGNSENNRFINRSTTIVNLFLRQSIVSRYILQFNENISEEICTLLYVFYFPTRLSHRLLPVRFGSVFRNK